MNKLFNLDIDFRRRLFYVLGWTACIANTIGFIANAVFYGFTWMTGVCGVCALIMYFATAWGIWGNRIRYAAWIVLLTINLIEFPLIYYVYGPGRVAYMFLGLVGIAAFMNGKRRVPAALFIILYDTVIIVLSVIFPSSVVNIDPKSDLGATIITFLVSAVSVALIVIMLTLQYQKQNKKMVELAEELKNMAHMDPLTKLYNRRFLTEYLEEKMCQDQTSIAVALLDLDDFKSINDRFGHLYGDKILEVFAAAMIHNMQNKGIAARFGGEEFMLVFNSVDHEEILNVMQLIQTELENFSMETKGIQMTFSGGVEEYHHGQDKITQLFNAADEKLYQAKHTGKNRIVL